MRPRAARTLAALIALSTAAGAQPVTTRRPTTVSLGTVLRADPAAAARQLALRRSEIARCIDDAAARATDRLAALRRVLVTLRLDRRGRAVVVELDPPLLSPGLSECIARVLLPWDQGGRPGARAVVQLRVSR